MAGTFNPGECLWVKSVSIINIHPGDVVVFQSQNRQERGGDIRLESEVQTEDPVHPANEKVHRVVAITSGGLITRGDNNPYPDKFLITDNQIVGRVMYVERGRKYRPVQGGQVGIMHLWLLSVKHSVRKLVIRLGRKWYYSLKTSGLISRLWNPQISRVYLTSEEGNVVKYVYRGRTVARWWPRQDFFECQKPYDLVLRKEELTYQIIKLVN